MATIKFNNFSQLFWSSKTVSAATENLLSGCRNFNASLTMCSGSSYLIRTTWSWFMSTESFFLKRSVYCTCLALDLGDLFRGDFLRVESRGDLPLTAERRARLATAGDLRALLRSLLRPRCSLLSPRTLFFGVFSIVNNTDCLRSAYRRKKVRKKTEILLLYETNPFT